jgi:regulator of Ty1 transposition protein 103
MSLLLSSACQELPLTPTRRRHADRIASYWLQRLRDSNSSKQLNLLYLVNEIVQNSRARRKDDFPNAFSPIMAEAAQTTYRSSTTEIQQKIRRLVEVWRARRVFEIPIQDAIEARLDDVDKTRPAGKKQLMGGSIFDSTGGSGSLPKGLESLAPPQLAVSKANLSTTATLNTANAEYDKLNDSNVQLPAPPLYAARLSALSKCLATAESSVAESIKARKTLIFKLEKILKAHRESLATDEASLQELQSRRTATENKRRDVEDSIRRTAASADVGGVYHNHGPDDPESFPIPEMNREPDLGRPEYEALTPPGVEALTPTDSPQPDPDPIPPPNPSVRELLASMSSNALSIPIPSPPSPHSALTPTFPVSSTFPNDNDFTTSNSNITGPASKKRKAIHDPAISSNGNGQPSQSLGFNVDLDEDVAEMIRQETG